MIEAHYQPGCMYTALNVYIARSSIGGAHAVEVFCRKATSQLKSAQLGIVLRAIALKKLERD